jgi:hypothetical protein
VGRAESGAVGVVETGPGRGGDDAVGRGEAGVAGEGDRSGWAIRPQPASIVSRMAKPHTILRRFTFYLQVWFTPTLRRLCRALAIAVFSVCKDPSGFEGFVKPSQGLVNILHSLDITCTEMHYDLCITR